MEVRVANWDTQDAEGDLVAVLRYEDRQSGHSVVENAARHGDFSGAIGTSLLIPHYGDITPVRIFAIGIGQYASLTEERLRKAAACAVHKTKDMHLTDLCIVMPASRLAAQKAAAAITEGGILAEYTYSKHTDPKHDKQRRVASLTIAAGNGAGALQSSVTTAGTICDAVLFARDLVNEGSEIVTTLHIEKVASAIAAETGLRCTVLDEHALAAQRMDLIVAVGRAGRTPPRLILLEYRGDPSKNDIVALVGKTITFDTGGVNLKPTGSIETMKEDMAGGATVLAVMRAISRLRLPINVVGVLAVAENGIGPHAYLPGEVFRSHNGKTVEIKNTDAEGRLVLADALSYTLAHHHPVAVVDVATLTGAASVALGIHSIPLISNNGRLSAKLLDAGERTHERCWPLPLFDEYKDEIKSDIADIKNVGDGRNAGTIAGAAFLSEFVGSTPWAHLDIAGVAYLDKGKGYVPSGGTGIGVRLLIEALSSWGGGVVEERGEAPTI